MRFETHSVTNEPMVPQQTSWTQTLFQVWRKIGIQARSPAEGKTWAVSLVVVLSALLGSVGAAHAQELDPSIYVLVDTSGSMLDTSTGGSYTYGDGSLEHPEDLAVTDPSRLYQAKQALSSVVFAYGEVRWGLARFRQNYGENYFCNCHEEIDNNTGAPCSAGNPGLYQEVDATGNPVCRSCDYYLDYPDYDLPAATNPGTHDRVCINYAGGIFVSTDGNFTPCLDPFADLSNPAPGDVLDGADILVSLADNNEDRILMWVDHQETDFQAGKDANGDFCFGGGGALGDCELRGMGGTPIGGALRDLYTRLSTTDLAADPFKGCRPYSIIVLTDGANSCTTDPVGWAGALQSVPDTSSTCDVGNPCPPNATCTGGICEYKVKVYVIGFALGPQDVDRANQIATAGATGHAILANNEAEITAAMAQIIADSFVPEQCNGADDDCDGLVDEDFPVGQFCDKGVGDCYATGTYECDPADPNAVVCNAADIAPGTEVCDGLDNDCDGLTDEDNVCCNGPEMCDGQDNYCGNRPGWMGDGDEDPRIWSAYPASGVPGTPLACGPSDGECVPGQMACVGGAPQCVGAAGPWTEQCDTKDWNCNAIANDVPPEACTITNTYGSCPGVRICELPGQWGACNGQTPAAEVCNNQDDNCNTQVDEGLDYLISCGLGACAHSVTYCVGGVEQTCDPLQGSTPETCDSLDNDCDGQTDEGLGTTTCGLGICEHTIQNCISGVTQTCDPLQGQQSETCNGLDDDCDGSIDENIPAQACYPPGPAGCTEAPPGTWTCVGTCATGTRTCAGGSWGGCLGATTPIPEACDGLDNDCNGLPDDGLGSTTCGLGNCHHTVQNCVGGAIQVCDPLQGAGPETCDGDDDDCNGLVDDGVSRVCYSGATGCAETPLGSGNWVCTGECATGVEACVVGGAGTWSGTCQGDVIPVAEICDGKDNDCDATVDEGVTRACYPFGSGCTARADGSGYNCVGACAAGNETCVVNGSGTWGACAGALGPNPEQCDGVDNDCDGDTDEDAAGQPLAQSCQKTNGSWTCTGSQVCIGGGWSACSAQDPRTEAWDDPNSNPAVCDTVDDNCNGVVNDGVPPRTCQVTNAYGTCSGTETCTAAGTWVNCTAKTPKAETCNGIDDDCDGQVDEDNNGQPLTQPCYGGPNGTAGTGVCVAGLRTCSGGGWGACQGQVLPTPEVCDGLDNDCDGATDEDPSGQPITRACQQSNANGTCLGSQTCTSIVGDLWTSCDAQIPAQEVCDGQDNNCDGVIDGISEACYPFASGCAPNGLGGFQCEGICWPGIRVCPALSTPAGSNTFGACTLAVGPATEVCNNLDDDCDGQTDETEDGTSLWRPCYWPGYGADTGCTAQGSCVGACREGLQVCGAQNPGEWGGCQGEVTPSTEVCDATDNDCDGQTDELDDMPWIGQPCPASLGVCNGVWQCVDGVQSCEGGNVNPGRCNGLDDDCDGVTDELDELQQDPTYGQSCGTDEGACEAGQMQCVGGAWQCVGAVVPSEEVCDGVDNDCDGVVDVGADCAPVGTQPTYCIEGDCRIECNPTAEFPCPGGMECVQKDHEGQSVTVCMPVVGECGGQTCPEGWVCQNDACVDPCDPNPCQGWQECRGGQCIDVSCTGIDRGCPAGQFCASHQCVPDPCLDADCGAQGAYCVRDCGPDACTARCEPLCLCPEGQYCGADGACLDNLCADAQCTTGDRCNPLSGDCEPNPCSAVFCTSGQTCFEGDCIDDPCAALVCPPAFECVVRTTLDATGNPSPAADCEPEPDQWTPPTPGDEYLATGSGCQCRSGGSEAPGVPAILFGLLLLGWIRRRRTAAKSDRSDSARPRGSASWRIAALLLIALLGATGCRLDPWSTGSDGGWNLRDAGPVDAIVTVDASPDACVPRDELCNGEDDDCDGVIDNGFDLQQDPNNCGTCGNVCEIPNALTACENGACVLSGCVPGHWDVNGDPDDGCEYDCHRTADGTEVCDGMDNDCDGAIDEDFDLQTDPNNCGACSNVCVFLNGNGACLGGSCILDSCRGGYVDIDGQAQNGCECRMDLQPGADTCVEGQTGTCGAGDVCADVTQDGTAHCATIPEDLCDGRDNDCDGQTDEDFLAGVPSSECFTFTSGCTADASGHYTCQGLCAPGAWTCAGGSLQCLSQTGPTAESCNDLDDDCNGIVDDGVDKQTDPNNCGACGHQCGPLLPNAIPGCAGGQCVIVDCLPGYFNLDTNQPGCEYACTVTNGGVERCGDGLDNDCNGQIDEGFDLTSDPQNCGACGHNCEVSKPFGTQVVSPGGCQSGACRFACLPDYYDRDGDLPTAGESGNGCEAYCQTTNPTELCDGLDNDCNGQVDEGFDLTSDVANCGACGRDCNAIAGANTTVTGCSAGTCQFICQGGYVDLDGDIALGSTGSGCECHVSAEVCGDGVDNDCNGQTDEAGAAGCTTYYRDGDGDTYGDASDSRCLCAAAPPYSSTNSQDCNDANGAVHPGATEVCDGVDNDCNTETDAVGGVVLSRSCYTGPAGTESNPPCQAGTQTCTGGAWSSTCSGEVTPNTETCDSVDNDCDGTADEGFDTTTDPQNCGACGNVCSVLVPHAVSTCQASTCQIVTCLSGYYDIDGSSANGCEYACTLQNGGVKTCGSPVDNDCNGLPDNTEFDTTTDLSNCGACGHICAANAPPGTQASACTASVCQFTCLAGYHDLDGDRTEGSNGCECFESNGGVEICDDVDNDCDGLIDENVDKQTDPTNCGACGHDCSASLPANAQLATPACQLGQCRYECMSGYYDLNGDLQAGAGSDGCEYPCTPTGAEVCDGVDNNCDGNIDKDASGQPLTQACYPSPPGYGAGNGCTGPGTCVGVCHEGTQTCSGGGFGACLGAVTPGNKLCGSTADNDCNGLADNTEFDLTSDVQNCGICGNNCLNSLPPNASIDSPGCVAGQCRYVCLPGFADLDGDLNAGAGTNGCEHTCDRYPTLTYEACNGIDDDCDGVADEPADLEPPPAICYQGVAGSPCQGSSAQCVDPDGPGGLSKGWYCNYPASVETVPGDPNSVLVSETLCDGQDGDCDGIPDDSFNLGAECDNGLLGTCRDVGALVCDTNPANPPVCDLSVLPDPDVAAQGPEICDAKDNDCDGLTDENAGNPGSNPSYVVDDMVSVTVGGVDVLVYSFEASRPDASSGDPGAGTDVRACSRAGVGPWNRVTHEQAADACARAGMRLCGAAEWLETCNTAGDTYPYGDTFAPQSCNGAQNATGGGDVLDTGALASCTSSGSGALDMSGNLREWTDDLISYTAAGKAIYRVRGGGYDDVGPTPPYGAGESSGLACDFTSTGFVEDVPAANLGFRCCTTCGNGTRDPGEDCDPAIDAGCNPVTCAWDPCGNGVADAGEVCDCGLDPDNLPGGCTAPNGWPGANCDALCARPPEDCSILTGDEDMDGLANCADPDCATAAHCDPSNQDADGDGFTPAMGDCNDGDPAIHPAADETCANGVDDNCNGFIDDAEPDKDGDGELRCVSGVENDCDDWDDARSPAHPEICGDGIDNDCDGLIDVNCATPCEIAAFNRSYIGCDYYAASTMNTQLDASFNANFAVVVHNPGASNANVTIAKGGVPVQTATLTPGQLQVFTLSYDLTLKNSNTAPILVAGGAYHITSDMPVSVYQFNPFDYHLGANYSYTNDASLVLPKSVLTRNYMVTNRQTWMANWDSITLPGFFAIIGTENNTQVQITYNGNVLNGLNRGQTETITLQAGDVYQVPSRNCTCGGARFCYCSSDNDFTGTRIQVTNPTGHPVAVIGGHDCTFIPEDEWACDHLEEMMFPLETWGKSYVATVTDYAPTNWFRVVSSADNNTVTFTPPAAHAPVTLQRGDYVEFEATAHFVVDCTEPCALTEFILADNYSPGDSDPAMALTVPKEQFRRDYAFAVPQSMTHNWVNVIKPVTGSSPPTVYLDGIAIPETNFSAAIGNSIYGVARLDISVAPYSHSIDSDQPFGIMVYGFARYTSFFYPGGLDLNLISSVN